MDLWPCAVTIINSHCWHILTAQVTSSPSDALPIGPSSKFSCCSYATAYTGGRCTLIMVLCATEFENTRFTITSSACCIWLSN